MTGTEPEAGLLSLVKENEICFIHEVAQETVGGNVTAISSVVALLLPTSIDTSDETLTAAESEMAEDVTVNTTYGQESLLRSRAQCPMPVHLLRHPQLPSLIEQRNWTSMLARGLMY